MKKTNNNFTLKRFWFIALVLIFTFSSSCSKKANVDMDLNNNQTKTNQQNVVKILRLASTDFKCSLDIQSATYGAVFTITDYVTETLLKRDGNNNIIPILLKELPKASSDGLIYTFELKSNVKFHNGEILKSSDVKFTFERVLAPTTKSPYASEIISIKGAAEVLTGKATELSGFKIVDDNKFEITLKEPFTPFIDKLTTSCFGIISEKAVKDSGSNWGISALVGTGPYKLTSYEPSKLVVLEKYNEYHNGAKKIDKVQFSIINDINSQLVEFEKGNLDMLQLPSNLYNKYSSDPKYKNLIVELPVCKVSYLAFNLKNYAKVKDVRVRQAISLAIDRNKIVNEILFGAGTPATGYLPELALGYNKNAPVLEYNPEKAKNLLAQAGYKNGLELELWYIRPIGIETALQAMLKDVGINLILKQLDAGVVKEAQNNGTIPMNLTYFAYSYSSPEPDGHFIYLDPENGGKHFAIFYNNENLKKLYRQGRTEQNETKRIEIYRKINEEILNVDLPVIPIHYDKRFYMINSRVKVNILPVNIDFADADISE